MFILPAYKKFENRLLKLQWYIIPNKCFDKDLNLHTDINSNLFILSVHF